MKYPEYYTAVKTIKLHDSLSEFLGSFEKGIIEFDYAQIVQSAGHSCPTVAGAYLMTLKSLEALYPNEIPERGNIKVEFKENIEEGVAGVIANVISNITGATRITGFKGIAGKYVRHSLMSFDAKINASARFTRMDTNKSVEVYYNPSSVGGSPMMQPLMQKIIAGMASPSEKIEFRNLWQSRVRAIIIDNCNNEEVIKVLEI